MKKFAAVFLALCMVLTMTAALAETRTYSLAAVTDAEGNTYTSDEFPTLYFILDGETMMAFVGTDEGIMEGTAETVELNQETRQAVLNVTLGEDAVMLIVYDADSDTMTYVDEAEGWFYTMVRVEMTEEAAQ